MSHASTFGSREKTSRADAQARISRESGRLVRLAYAFVGLSVLSMLAFVVLDYQRTLRDIRAQLEHVATLFNQTFTSSLATATARVTPLAERLAEIPLQDLGRTEVIFGDELRDLLAKVPQVQSLLLVDDKGIVIWASVPAALGLDVSDRGYFRSGLARPPGSYALGQPIVSRASGNRLTPIAWPIAGPGAPVRGVLASSLEEHYFGDLLARTRYDPDMIITIATRDGEVSFTSTPEPPERAMIQRSSPIIGTDLLTSVAIPRSNALQGFYRRSLAFGVTSLLLLGIAITAARAAQRRAHDLRATLKRTEFEALRARQAEAEYRTIFENVEDGIVVFNDAETIHQANRRAQQLLEAHGSRPAIRALRAVLPPFRHFENGSETFHLRMPQHSTQAVRELRCRVDVIETTQGRTLYCVLNDVSAEERLTSTRAKFIASVNHELRTPLTSLSGSLALAVARFGKDLHPSLQKLLALANQNAERLLLLVNDILTLQAMDQEHLYVEVTPLDSDDVLTEAVTAMDGYATSANVAIERDTTTAGASFEGDRIRMQQILANLMSNAIKYSPSNGTIEVATGHSPTETWFRISDHGPGIPRSAQATIFNRFAPPAHPPEVQATGSGLGLAITRELVDRQGGRIELRSDPAEAPGTTFLVFFPRIPKPDQTGDRP
ncbi:PAS domain-containing protein [Aquicoccus sp. SCR17]|nr:PAS domain-containing protein [Carideicomes alvinocaridis]